MGKFKTFLYTSLFWIVVVGGLTAYMKWFDNTLATQVTNFIGDVKVEECIDPNDEIIDNLDTVFQELQSVKTELNNLKTATPVATTPVTKPEVPVAPMTTETVKLFYFNQIEDSTLPPLQQINTSSVLPVERTIQTNNVIKDTIELLIQGQLNQNEIANGFVTEFPNDGFKLLNAELKNNVLYLKFTEVPWFTSGWSARMLIMRSSIEKTALQFPTVKRVEFIPETLFQP